VLLALVAALAGMWLARMQAPPAQAPAESPALALEHATVFPAPRPLPAFELIDQHSRPFGPERFKGHWSFVFFGFTNCPDVCPTTLLTMSNHLRSLGDKADRFQVLFVTVDPERDTAAHLANYLSSFDPRIIGLTGSAEEIRKVARIYRVSYRKVAAGQTYTMDHTATVFLVDARGRLAGTLELEGAEAGQLARLRKLVGE
jgi:protein SCO1/2